MAITKENIKKLIQNHETEALESDMCDVIKIFKKEGREEKWERKPLKKRWIQTYFYDATHDISRNLVKNIHLSSYF